MINVWLPGILSSRLLKLIDSQVDKAIVVRPLDEKVSETGRKYQNFDISLY